MCVVAMEDISDYKNLRSELMNRTIFPTLAEDITTFMVNTLLPTTDLVMDSSEKKEMQSSYINKDLCKISEDLVLTEPFINNKGRNIILDEQLEYVKKEIYEDKELVLQAGILKNKFMNNAQALLHGDLHSGSIFANQVGIKVLDPEFAFYGPIGYDLGNVIGNLVFALEHSKVVDKSASFTSWVEKTIVDIIGLFIMKFNVTYDEMVTDVMARTPEFKAWYLQSILQDAAGYAGTEIIRRTIGDSKVAEVSSLKGNAIRVTMERELIQLGKLLIKDRNKFKSSEQFSEFIKL